MGRNLNLVGHFLIGFEKKNREVTCLSIKFLLSKLIIVAITIDRTEFFHIHSKENSYQLSIDDA